MEFLGLLESIGNHKAGKYANFLEKQKLKMGVYDLIIPRNASIATNWGLG
jgi:hypothetical protein